MSDSKFGSSNKSVWLKAHITDRDKDVISFVVFITAPRFMKKGDTQAIKNDL